MNKESSEIICKDNFYILRRVNAIMQNIYRLKNENVNRSMLMSI